jgi:hypothetical protein
MATLFRSNPRPVSRFQRPVAAASPPPSEVAQLWYEANDAASRMRTSSRYPPRSCSKACATRTHSVFLSFEIPLRKLSTPQWEG